MITTVNNYEDAMAAFNENLSGLLTGKRKIQVVKETNNTLGKLTGVVKMKLMYMAIVGDRTPLDWFNSKAEVLELKASSTIPQIGKSKSKKKTA